MAPAEHQQTQQESSLLAPRCAVSGALAQILALIDLLSPAERAEALAALEALR